MKAAKVTLRKTQIPACMPQMAFVTMCNKALPAHALDLPDLDLALLWADVSPISDFDLDETSPCGLTVSFELQPSVSRAQLLDLLDPTDILHASWAGKQAVFGTAHISWRTCARWLGAQGRKVVARFELGLPWREQRPEAQAPGANDGAPGLTPNEVGCDPKGDVWIVVDDGCPWARSDLRLADGRSRLRSLWYQGEPVRSGASASPAFPGGHGRVWSGAALDDVLSVAGHDAAACYARLGDRRLARRTSHGAHILGLLLGRPGDLRPDHELPLAERGVRDPAGGRDLVFVQLPRRFAGTVSRAALTPWVLQALLHGVHHASPSHQAVATLSLEAYDGPHDGSSLFETGLQALIEHARQQRQVDLRVVMAAGNAHLRRVAQSIDLQPGQEGTLCWRVPPGSERAAWLELWFPADRPLPEICMAAPGHGPSAALSPGQVWSWPSQRSPACAVLIPTVPRRGGWLILIRLAPTSVFHADEPAAPCGDWRVVLTSTQSLRVHAYLARTWAGVGGRPRGRQGRLMPTAVAPAGDLQPSVLPPSNGSISGLACGGPDITVVGSCLMFDPQTPGAAGGLLASTPPGTGPEPAPYSGRGPARGGWRAGAGAVQALAPGEESRCRPGLRSHGHLEGSCPRMGGTSMAVPLYAREMCQPGREDTLPP